VARKKGYTPETFEVDGKEQPGKTFEIDESQRSAGQFRARTISPRTQGTGGTLERPPTIAERIAGASVKVGAKAGHWVLHGSGKPKKQMRGYTSSSTGAGFTTGPGTGTTAPKKRKTTTSSTRKKKRKTTSRKSSASSGSSGPTFVFE